MRSYIDENDKKNEIRLLFKHPLYKEKVIIIVEGQADVRLFRSLLDDVFIKIETIDGKRQLVEVMTTLVGEFPQQILGICDSDFDRLTGCADSREEYSVYVTDEHDAEMMMLSSPSLDSFVMEYAAIDNADVIQQNLLNNAFEVAYIIGLLRWLNEEEVLNINFKGLNFNTFIDVNKLNISIDVDSLIDELLKRSSNKPDFVCKQYLQDRIEDYKMREACEMQVCSGHDVTNIIAIVFRQRWASLELNMDRKKVESCLRIGFQKSFFFQKELYRKIHNLLTSFGFELHGC